MVIKMYEIISDETFEDSWGDITHKGDHLETTMHEEESEFRRYVFEKYGPAGENIKIKWRKIK